MAIERELKLLADAEQDLPDLDGIVDGASIGAPSTARLVATYFDTADYVLARHGLTLRSRAGEPGPNWTLKLPIDDGRSETTRREVTVTSPGAAIPAELRDLVTAFVRRNPLSAVATIRTDRTTSLVVLDGATVATISDDAVTATVDGQKRAFREIEIELADADDDRGLLKAFRTRLRAAGFRVEGHPPTKLHRVLGPKANAAPDVVVRELTKHASVGDAVTRAIARSVDDLVRHDPGTRLGLDIEELHQFRVATRRLRSDLRTFRALLAPEWTQRTREELRWLGESAGAVRDLDVLDERLRRRVAALDDSDRAGSDELLAVLNEQRDGARAELRVVLSSERYLDLLESLVEAARHVPFARDNSAGATGRRASKVLPDLVKGPWRKLSRSASRITHDSADSELHAVRIVAKRCRYAADAAAVVCGPKARRFAGALKDLQNVLGDHQDTAVTEAWLRTVTDSHSQVASAADHITAAEVKVRGALRGKFERSWDRASRPSLRSWFD